MQRRNVASRVVSLATQNVDPRLQDMIALYSPLVPSDVVDRYIEKIDGTPPLGGTVAQYEWLDAVLRVCLTSRRIRIPTQIP